MSGILVCGGGREDGFEGGLGKGRLREMEIVDGELSSGEADSFLFLCC